MELTSKCRGTGNGPGALRVRPPRPPLCAGPRGRSRGLPGPLLATGGGASSRLGTAATEDKRHSGQGNGSGGGGGHYSPMPRSAAVVLTVMARPEGRPRLVATLLDPRGRPLRPPRPGLGRPVTSTLLANGCSSETPRSISYTLHEVHCKKNELHLYDCVQIILQFVYLSRAAHKASVIARSISI